MFTKPNTTWKDWWSTSKVAAVSEEQKHHNGMLHAIMTGQGILTNTTGPAVTQRPPYPSHSWNDPLSGMKFEVVNAENGFVLKVAANEGERWRLYVAANVDEVRDIITSQMVTQRMEK